MHFASRTTGLLLALGVLAGCNSIQQEQTISQCGGFGSSLPYSSRSSLSSVSPQAYCDQEVLVWSHDEAGTLTLHHRRQLLNCCGDRKARLEERGEGRYVLLETDAPEGLMGARCGCMCVFDWAVKAEDLPRQPLELEILLDVTDDDSPTRSVWKGTLDLQQGTGTVVIDSTSLEGWCQ